MPKIWVLLFLVTYLPALAQEGLDREFRVDEEEVPGAARKFMQDAGFTRKIKWYEEHAVNEITFEGKSRIGRNRYSIEFYPSGALKDVELRISFDAIPAEPRVTISAQIDSIFDAYRILETQIQWSGQDSLLLRKIRHPESEVPLRTSYEIILKGKQKSGRSWFEMLFADNGDILEFDAIRVQSTHHLDF